MDTIQIRARGTLTIPKEIREKYRLQEGDLLSLLDLEDGALLLVAGASRVAALGKDINRILEEKGVYQGEIQAALDEERERYYREQYGRG